MPLPGNNLRYLIDLAKDADLGKLRLAYTGIDALKTDADGNLVISTPFGDFVERPPKVRRNGKNVDVCFIILEQNTVGFKEPTLLEESDK